MPTETQPLVLGDLGFDRTARRRRCSSTGTSTSSRPTRSSSGSPIPFTLEQRGEWLFGRGVADDKGQLYMLAKAAAELSAAGELPVNVRFACDSEEETGGHQIVDFLAADERGGGRCADLRRAA